MNGMVVPRYRGIRTPSRKACRLTVRLEMTTTSFVQSHLSEAVLSFSFPLHIDKVGFAETSSYAQL